MLTGWWPEWYSSNGGVVVWRGFRTFFVDDDGGGGGGGGDRGGGCGVCDGDLRFCMTDCNLDHESRLGPR